MAPRNAPRKGRDNDFSAVGEIGRRTGVTLPQGRLDENGIEEITGIFSSPRKPSPLRKSINAHGIVAESSTSDGSTSMRGIDSSGLTPTQALSARKSFRGPSLPPPRSASPRKAGITGSARRSHGVDVFTPAKTNLAFSSEDRENTPVKSSTDPAGPATTTIRRFSPSSEKPALHDITPVTRATTSVSALPNDWVDAGQSDVSGYNAPDIYEQAGEEVEDAENSASHFDNAPIGFGGEEEDEEEDQFSSIVGERDVAADRQTPHDDDVEADEMVGLPLGHRAGSPGPAKANSRKKRRSDLMVRGDGEVEPSSPVAKRARKLIESQADEEKPGAASSTTLRQQSDNQRAAATTKAKRGRPAAKGNAAVAKISAQQAEELDNIIEKVKSRPGQSKSLYILRRETPADDAVTHTRSGRVSVKPLAYWRNERCVYGGSPRASNLQDGARFPLNSIKEIIRTEEVENAAGKSKGRKKGRRGRGRAAVDHDMSHSEISSEGENAQSDPDAEPWESAVGIFRGSVSVWDAQQQMPLEEEEEVDLAYAPASIQTREVKGSTFRYAKLLSTKFFGTGIVDLPPGGVKRPKNSRKMHMSFFVAKGRVTVQVGALGGEESRFSVGKGGFWQVPRGNQYSIENELDKPARIFFSQGCEPAPEGEE